MVDFLRDLDPQIRAQRLRKQADDCDARAAAAKLDNDPADEVKWRHKAQQLRRSARELEFGK